MTLYKIDGPDGKEYQIEGPEGMNRTQVIMAIQAQISPSAKQPLAPYTPPQPGKGGTILNPIASGASLGWMDELLGAAGATFGMLPESMGGLPGENSMEKWKRDYEGIRGNIDANTQAFAQRNPGTALAAELAGGLTTGGVGAGRAATMKAVQNAPKYLRYGGAGAASGGIAGAGYSQPGERARGAGVGAAMGGLLGTAVPAVVGAGKAGINKAKEFYGSQVGVADRKILEALSRDEMTPLQLQTRMQKLGPGAMPIDAGGENLIGLGRAAAAFPGKAKNQAERMLQQRDYKQADRVTGKLNETLSPVNDFYGSIDELEELMKTNSGPLYKLVEKVDVPLNDKLQGFLRRKVVAKAWKAAQREANTLGQEVPQGFTVADGAVVADKMVAPSMKAWDWIKRGLDTVIDKEIDKVTGKVTPHGVNIIKAKQELVEELDTLTKGLYKRARDAYAGPASLRTAMQRGRKFLNDDAEMTARKIAKLGDSEKVAFRAGAVRAVRDKVLGAGDTHDVYKRIFQNRMVRDRLEAAFPSKRAFRQFQSHMLKEKNMRLTKEKVLGNSVTARLEAEKADTIVSPSAMVDVLSGRPGRAVGDVVSSLANRATAPTDRLRTQLGGLFSDDPQIQQAQIQRLMELLDPALQQQGQRRALGLSGAAGTAAPSLIY